MVNSSKTLFWAPIKNDIFPYDCPSLISTDILEPMPANKYNKMLICTI